MSARETTRPAAVDAAAISRNAAMPLQDMAALARRFGAEFREMPGLRLTSRQAARLFGVEADIAVAVLDELRRASILARSHDGQYSLISEDR